MIGRGVLADPAIARKIKGGDGADKAEMRHFHDMLYEAYCEEMSGERTVLYKNERTVVLFWRPLLLIADHTQRRSKKRKNVLCTKKL